MHSSTFMCENVHHRCMQLLNVALKFMTQKSIFGQYWQKPKRWIVSDQGFGEVYVHSKTSATRAAGPTVVSYRQLVKRQIPSHCGRIKSSRIEPHAIFFFCSKSKKEFAFFNFLHSFLSVDFSISRLSVHFWKRETVCRQKVLPSRNKRQVSLQVCFWPLVEFTTPHFTHFPSTLNKKRTVELTFLFTFSISDIFCCLFSSPRNITGIKKDDLPSGGNRIFDVQWFVILLLLVRRRSE